jgi:Protein of unknown function (DUF2934)
MATVKKGNGTTARRRTKSSAGRAATATQELKDEPASNGAGASGSNVEMNIEAIRVRAYQLFLARGAAHGDDLGDWLNAEKELRGAQT